MQGIAFAVIFLAILLLPGLALSQLFEPEWIKRSRFLFVVGFSYALFVLVLGIFQFLQISWWYFSFSITGILVLSITTIAYCLTRVRMSGSFFEINKARLMPLIIVGLVSCYHFLVGAYNEIPADIYAHLGYFQTALDLQQQGSIGSTSGAEFFMQKGLVWYHLLAFCSKVSGASAEITVYVTTWLTKILLLLSVYFFSVSIFDKSKNVNVIAVLATIFLALHLGINVMAYIRYYSFAPTMLNLVLYFSAIIAFLRLLKAQRVEIFIGLSSYIALLILATAAIHTQETLFIVVMCALISLVDVLVFSSVRQEAVGNSLSRHCSKMILFVALLGFVVVYIVASHKLQRAPNIGWRLWEFGVISEWLPKLTTLNLKYQFIRVITLWGVLVYIAVIFYWREIRQHTFLVAGLISPLFTIMNPFFVDLFLRLDNSTTLWRMSYLIPLHFVAAFLVVKIVNSYRDGSALTIKKMFGVVFVLLSVVLLLPLNNTYAGLHYSRFPTLIAVDSQNNYDHIEDAINALEAIENKSVVLTDPVTGYVISGMTRHHSYRHKFFPRGYLEFSFQDYSDLPLRKHKGKLLLINARSGAYSEVGSLSKHWSENALDVSRYYSKELIMHLKSNPTRFSLLWESQKGDMRLYKIL